MASKKNNRIPMPNDAGHDFIDDDNILNFKPTIQFVSPPHQPAPPGNVSSVDELGDARQATQDLIDGYDTAAQLVEMAQQRIDERVDSLGGFDINLDPKVDAAIIAAMKRFCPTNPNPTKISYECYQQALQTISASAVPPATYGPFDLQEAQNNPNKTNFGGMDALPGLNRPEVNSPGNAVSPLDIPAFQAKAVTSLFNMMVPMIKKLVGIP